MELEVTWKRAVRIWWSILWRNLIAILCALVLGGVFGFIVGFIIGLLGADFDSFKWIIEGGALLIGVAVTIVPIKLVLGKAYGDFRLVLVENKKM